MHRVFVDNTKVVAKEKITLPKDIREALGVKMSDTVTLISQNNQVIVMNSAVYAMKIFQTSMTGEAKRPDCARMQMSLIWSRQCALRNSADVVAH